MSPYSRGSIGISDLIDRLKTDLLSQRTASEPSLFSIDEITVEVNFTVEGDIDSGFNFGVVTLGSQVSEERIQKVTVKMSPIVSKQQLIENINKDPNKADSLVDASKKVVFRGRKSD